MKYYIVNPVNRTTYYVAATFNDMIQWFALRNHHYNYYYGTVGTKVNPKSQGFEGRNRALPYIAMSQNDVVLEFADEYTCRYVQRDIMVFDEYDRVVDPRHFWVEIALFNYKKYVPKRTTPAYIFRYDPVPKLRQRRRYKSRGYRRPKTMQERRLSCDHETKEYIRPNRSFSHLPHSWDDIPRFADHSWKEKRFKRQWMKHL